MTQKIIVDFEKLNALKNDYSDLSQKMSSIKQSANNTSSLDGSWGIILQQIGQLYKQSRDAIMSSFDSSNDIFLKVNSNLTKAISNFSETEYTNKDEIRDLNSELEYAGGYQYGRRNKR